METDRGHDLHGRPWRVHPEVDGAGDKNIVELSVNPCIWWPSLQILQFLSFFFFSFFLHGSRYVCVCVRARARACRGACVRACVACVRACIFLRFIFVFFVLFCYCLLFCWFALI